MNGLQGRAATLEASCDLAPWGDHLGLRFNLGTSIRVGWGIWYGSTDLTWHPLGHDRWVTPFLAAGVYVGGWNMAEWVIEQPLHTGLATIQAAAGKQPPEPGDELLRGGPTSFAVSVGPQATAGVQLGPVEVAARYSVLRWRGGDLYSNLTLLVGIVGPNHW